MSLISKRKSPEIFQKVIDVYELLQDEEYIDSLIEKYWFITDEIKQEDIYYPLEGYLKPDTYIFEDKDVSVKYIFSYVLNYTDKQLDEYKDEIEKSGLTVHQILTIASIVELEGSLDEDRAGIAGVFFNRLYSKMSLGSDVTTRYAIKLDDKRALKKSEYNSVNAYNTRSSTMAGKLPAGPIGMISESSILASLNYPETDYLYFIANINTGQTFFYSNSKDFEKKKQELASVNQGY